MYPGSTSEPVPRSNMLAVMYKLSVVCNALLQEDSPPPVDPADPLITLRIIEAAQQSARDGNVVKLVS